MQLHIFAHQGRWYVSPLAGELTLHHGAPLGQVAGWCAAMPSRRQHQFVQPFLVQQQRHLINGAGVAGFGSRTPAGRLQNRRDLGPQVLGNLVLGAAHQDVRGNADAAAAPSPLCWVGLVFSSPAALRYGTSVTWMIQAVFVARPRARIWRMASRKGWLSMSPTVPPISVMTTSGAFCARDTARILRLISLVICGIT